MAGDPADVSDIDSSMDLELRTEDDRTMTVTILEDGTVRVGIVHHDQARDVSVEITDVVLSPTHALALWLWLDSATDAMAAYDPIALGC